jgi:hypothetical protein
MSDGPGAAPVNAPQPIRVSTDAQGRPVRVQIKSRLWEVQTVHDHWVQEPDPPEPPRAYFLLRLEGDRLCCVFHSTTQGRWFRQRISRKAWTQRTLSSAKAP